MKYPYYQSIIRATWGVIDMTLAFNYAKVKEKCVWATCWPIPRVHEIIFSQFPEMEFQLFFKIMMYFTDI